MSLPSIRSFASPGLEPSHGAVVRAVHEALQQPRPVPERNLALCEYMLDIVAAMFNICGRELRKPGRPTLAVARVRQIAMYVCHVVFELGMRDIGCGFGRDRTTVVHACCVIENMRDDAEFDCIVGAVEKVAAVVFRIHCGDRP